jgi:hypothetical protein
MVKLSDLIKKENCFVTIDGKVLKNVLDLRNYLSSCSQQNYLYHVNGSKNDFASWTRDILVSKNLADNLFRCTNLDCAIKIISTFLDEFDYQSKKISDSKAFHTRESFNLKNIQELYYYINNSDDETFNYYVNTSKNDFANWVGEVLLFPDLALKMRSATKKSDIILLLKNFLLDNFAYDNKSEYKRYIEERLIKTASNNNPTMSDIIINNLSSDISKAASKMSEDVKKYENTASINNINALSLSATSSGVNSDLLSKHDLSDTGDALEETIDLSKRPNLERKEEPEKVTPQEFDMSEFKQYSDEELEKFVSFIKKEVTIDPNIKVEYLKNAFQELTNMIRDLRRLEKDPLIAELMLRTISAKIDYYAISNNLEDYNHIIRMFKDVQHEIEECATQQSYNLADEIFNNLKFQAIALKKA